MTPAGSALYIGFTWQWTSRLHRLENSSGSSLPLTFTWWVVKNDGGRSVEYRV